MPRYQSNTQKKIDSDTQDSLSAQHLSGLSGPVPLSLHRRSPSRKMDQQAMKTLLAGRVEKDDLHMDWTSLEYEMFIEELPL